VSLSAESGKLVGLYWKILSAEW